MFLYTIHDTSCYKHVQIEQKCVYLEWYITMYQFIYSISQQLLQFDCFIGRVSTSVVQPLSEGLRVRFTAYTSFINFITDKLEKLGFSIHNTTKIVHRTSGIELLDQ